MKKLLVFFSVVFSLSFVSVSETKAHTNPSLNLAVSVAFDQHGQLWRASVQNDFVFVDNSSDMGKTFSNPVKVNTKPQQVVANNESHPKIVIAPNGHIYLTWTQHLNKLFATNIRFARSVDGGKNFEQLTIVHQDRAKAGHSYDVLNVAPDGKITVAWIDEGNLAMSEKHSGAAIFYTVSTDNGASFQKQKALTNSSSVCCRIAMIAKPDSTVVALWQHVFDGNEHDYMIAEIPEAGETPHLARVTFSHWKLGDRHYHGSELARGGEGDNWWGYHIAYFGGKKKNPSLYYSRIDGEAWVGFPAKKIGDNTKQARYPSLLSIGDDVWLVWLETAANDIEKVMGKMSVDGGKSWSDTSELLSVKGKVDYPKLLQYKGKAYLVANTDRGLKVTSIKP